MAGQQADPAAFHLASPGPGSSQYLCLDRPHPQGWERSGRVHSPGDFGVPMEPTLGCDPLQKRKGKVWKGQCNTRQSGAWLERGCDPLQKKRVIGKEKSRARSAKGVHRKAAAT